MPPAVQMRSRQYPIARPASQLEDPIAMHEAAVASVLSIVVSWAAKAEYAKIAAGKANRNSSDTTQPTRYRNLAT